MEAFVSRKKRKLSTPPSAFQSPSITAETDTESTDLKLALLASIHPHLDASILLDALISANGSVPGASDALFALTNHDNQPPNKPLGAAKNGSIGIQTSLTAYRLPPPTRPSTPTLAATLEQHAPPRPTPPLTRKNQTLHLYHPPSIAAHTPCSIIHNFLPSETANALLKELLVEAETFDRARFQLFGVEVASPHTNAFYVGKGYGERDKWGGYLYNGAVLEDIRQLTPLMMEVSSLVESAVNVEIATRIQTHYPNAQRLKYQSPSPWIPNAAFVNCYSGGSESVGYHSDQLTYLGPRAVIGSLSLGVAREFRVRRIVARDEDEKEKNGKRADAEGQIAIHLPHNSLLVMHAEMQEEWKHSIHPALAIDPHPVAGNRRINVTYRHYRESFHPKYTPRCKCGIATVLRCVQRKQETRGRYMWMCHAGNAPGKEGCSFFQWAEFDEDGNPPWVKQGRPP